MAPPLAGRPPFATDEPDSVYEDPEAIAPRRRQRQLRPQDNRPDSSYDVYVLHTYLSPQALTSTQVR